MLTEIRPAEAPPAIAAVYADIRAVSGVPIDAPDRPTAAPGETAMRDVPSEQVQDAPPDAPLGAPLPPLPAIETLPPGLAATIRALAAAHAGTEGGVIPSLYLALAPWPGLLAALPRWLAPLYAPDALRAARAATVRAAEAAASGMLPAVGPLREGLGAMRPTLDRFTRLVIPDLIPVCLALRGLLSAG